MAASGLLKGILAASLAANVALAGLAFVLERQKQVIRSVDLPSGSETAAGEAAAPPAPPALGPAADPYAPFKTTQLPAATALNLPVEATGDLEVFRSVIYGSPSPWNPFVEHPVVGRVLPVLSSDARRLLDEAPRIDASVGGVETLLQWYADCQWTTCAEAFPNRFGNTPQEIVAGAGDIRQFCNDLVSTFRTFLLAQSIVSRPVFFEYGDSYGGGSHTFLEVWVDDLNQWVYADPFYKAYAPKSVGELVAAGSIEAIVRLPVAAGDLSVADDATRDAHLTRAFTEGWASWSVPNGLTGFRIVYLDPRHYGTELNHGPDTFGPFEDDLIY